MQQLIHFLEVPVHPMPRLENDCVKTLLKHIYHGITDELLLDYMSQRHAKSFSKFQSVFGHEGMSELVADVVDPDLKDEILKSAKDYQDRLKAAQLMKETIKGPDVKKNGVKKKKCAEKDFHYLEASRKLLPDVVGCRLDHETEWHNRYKASYPCDYPPFSFPCHFDEADDKSKVLAMKTVLFWVWTMHTHKTGEPCPYDFGF